MNEAVLQAIEEHALTPEAVERVVRLTERDDLRGQQDALQRERKDVQQRIARLVCAIEAGGDVPSLVAKVQELEARRTTIDRDLPMLRAVPRLAPTVVEDRLAEWRRLLRQSTTQGRAVLQWVLEGRIVFTPTADGAGYTFEAPTRFDRLFCLPALWWSARPGWTRATGGARNTSGPRTPSTPTTAGCLNRLR